MEIAPSHSPPCTLFKLVRMVRVMGILDKITEPLKEYVSVFNFIKGLSQYNNQNLYDVVTYLNHYDFAENVTVYFIDIDYKIEPLEFDCYNNELRSKLDKLQTASYLEDFVWSNENFEKLKSSDKFKLIESLADFANIYNTVHWHFSIQELASIEPLEGLLGFLGNDRISITLSEPQAGEAKQETVILQRDPLLTDLDIFNILEASCLISGDDPIQIEICIGDTYFRQNNIKYLKAEKLIRAGIKSGNLDHDITRQSLQNFLKIKGYIINGFNDNLPTLPTPQTDSQLLQKVADQQTTIDQQAKEIAELKAQLASIEQAGKDTQSNTPADRGQGDSLLILGAVMATIEQVAKTNYTQASFIENHILPKYGHINGISESTLQKKFSQAKTYLKQKV